MYEKPFPHARVWPTHSCPVFAHSTQGILLTSKGLCTSYLWAYAPNLGKLVAVTQRDASSISAKALGLPVIDLISEIKARNFLQALQ